jgi:hypothetical protein
MSFAIASMNTCRVGCVLGLRSLCGFAHDAFRLDAVKKLDFFFAKVLQPSHISVKWREK